MSARRTPWILGGMAILAIGGIGAALATAWAATNAVAGIALAVAAFALIGIGVGAAGVSVLALLATRVEARRRPAAASIVWLMMIAGFVVTATTAGHFLDPFSTTRLVAIAGIVSLLAFAATVLAVAGVEGPGVNPIDPEIRPNLKSSFRGAVSEIWAEAATRRFTIFIFVSMLAFSGQDLILEPFAGAIFGMTPGESTRLSGIQSAGVFVGMIAVAIAGSAVGGGRIGSMRAWTIIGCVASTAALLGLTGAGFVGADWPLRESVFLLGLANGMFAVAAIAMMMTLASAGGAREGVRMGLWGAGQAVAFGLGGFLGTAAVDVVRLAGGSAREAYAMVFCSEALLFLAAGLLAARIGRPTARNARSAAPQVHQLAVSRR
jgi:BCD family chlorophyll transporter-like MFS transporter